MYSNEYIADGLLVDNFNWSTSSSNNTITYSFKTQKLDYESDNDHLGFVELSQDAKDATTKIFDYISSLIDVNFTLTQDVGNIVLASREMDKYTLGYAYLPGSKSINSSAGDLYLNSSLNSADYSIGGIGWSTLVHEIGHTLGLNHPFGNAEVSDVSIYQTAMSYNTYSGYDTFNEHYFDTYSFTSFQEADILALQSLYGKNETTSNNTYDMSKLLYSDIIDGSLGSIQDNLYTIDDYAGTDTIDISTLLGNNNQYIDLNGSSRSILTNNDTYHYVTITTDSSIENSIGSNGNDTFILNTLNNTINGNEGIDTVYIQSNEEFRVDFINDKTLISTISGFDTLTSIENLYINLNQIEQSNFARQNITTNDQEDASSISRLYLSVFNRLADADGLNYWIERINDGMSLNDISDSFIISNEFETRYGSQNDLEYINLLYTNILNRTSDSDGENYWATEMSNGFSKADVLVSFSESSEFIELTGIYFEDNTIAVL